MLVAVVVGFLFGFVGSMPVAGPISLLVVSRAIEGRYRNAAGIAAGSAVAEAAYAFLAFWGFSALLGEYPYIVPIARGAAAAVLIGLGALLVRGRATGRPGEAAERPGGRARSGVLLGLTVNLLNPTLLVTWTAAVTAVVSTGHVHLGKGMALPFSLAACAGIVSWFALLLLIVRRFKGRFSTRVLNRLIRVMGAGLVLLGLWFLWLLVRWLAWG